jgi:imidazole glycerol-phosphate synthase subunit HisH
MRLVIIDYGSGNLRSVVKAFERAAQETTQRIEIVVTDKAEIIAKSESIVLPGVGAFADCKAGLESVEGLSEVLHERVFNDGVPFLGICVGMQLMASRGLEKTSTQGLGWIAGDVIGIKPHDTRLKIPHMGWNQITLNKPHPVFDGILTGEHGLHAYFVHSYHMTVDNPQDILATTHYDTPMTAVIAKDNMIGTQFHPEKSQKLGLQLIENFLRWKP